MTLLDKVASYVNECLDRVEASMVPLDQHKPLKVCPSFRFAQGW